MVTLGLRGAGIAKRNGHPGLARSRDCVPALRGPGRFDPVGPRASASKSPAEKQIETARAAFVVARAEIDGPQERVDREEYRCILAGGSHADVAALFPRIAHFE